MSPVFANFKKYHPHWSYTVCGYGLALPLIVLVGWCFREMPSGPGRLIGCLIFPFTSGLIVGFVEKKSIQLSMVWSLPGHVRSVRILIGWIGLGAVVLVILLMIQSRESFQPLQIISIGAFAALAFCFGLIPRLFPFDSHWMARGLAMWPVWFVLFFYVDGTRAFAPVEYFVLEMPVLFLPLAVTVGVLVWRRLGNDKVFKDFLRAWDNYNRERIAKHQWRSWTKRKSGWMYRLEGRLLRWVNAKIEARPPEDWKGAVHGVFIEAGRPGAIRDTVRLMLFPPAMLIFLMFQGSTGEYPLSGLFLHALIALPFIPLAAVLKEGWKELESRRQAPLLLPTSRPVILRCRWALLAAIFGVSVFAFVSQFAVSLAVHTFLTAPIPGEAAREFHFESWLNWSPLVAVVPLVAGLRFAMVNISIRTSWAILIIVSAVTGIGTIVAVMLIVPADVLRVYVWSGIAGIWALAVPLIRRRTLSKDI